MAAHGNDSVHEGLDVGDANQVPEARSSGPGFYRLGTNQSNASIFEDVEMAHDEVSGCYC
jgi:cation-transporting ATPase 13A3/4/5